jgi:hypothetical protein
MRRPATRVYGTKSLLRQAGVHNMTKFSQLTTRYPDYLNEMNSEIPPPLYSDSGIGALLSRAPVAKQSLFHSGYCGVADQPRVFPYMKIHQAS